MMLGNYLKTAGRNFIKHRLYSTINVAGLAVGLTCCLLIALYVVDESSYDRQHPDAERIYRFSQTYLGLEEPLTMTTASPQVGPMLQESFDEVESTLRTYRSPRVFLDSEGRGHEEQLLFAEASAFDFFSLDWVQGDPATALAEPNTVVLTRSLARKYFGDADPYGQPLLSGDGNRLALRVTGVVEDLPYNMHLSTSAFVSFASLAALMPPGIMQNWEFANFTTYLKLKEAADFALLSDAFISTVLNGMPEDMRGDWRFQGLPVTDIHLHSPLEGLGVRSSGKLANVVILGLIGAGLLLLAGINFVNLSTARALQRGKEISVRKAIGSSRRQLFQQFMGESLLLVVVAFALALALAELVLPVLNAFAGKQMSLVTLFASLPAVLTLAAAVGVVAFLAGCYPALYLSALRPAARVSSRGSVGTRFSLRDILVVMQFSLAIALVIATLVVYAQVRLGKTVELGFNKEQLLVLEFPNGTDFSARWPAFRNELQRHPEIAAITAPANRPFQLFVRQFDLRYEGGDRPAVLTEIQVDYDFFQTYQVSLLAGRMFRPEYGGDMLVTPSESNPTGSAGFIINRAAAELMGWTPEQAVGKWLERDYSEDFSRVVRGSVIGVVENMRIDSLRDAIRPMFYLLDTNTAGLGDVALRLEGNTVEEALAHVDAAWARVYPGQPVNRKFIDEDFDALYRQEERFAQLLTVFSGLAILVSCLGLFGLAAFTVERRTKEIGIRKVMGSSVWRIVWLLTNDFSRLVLIANLIAWPVAYISMDRWLQQFAYRVDLTPLVFIGSGLIALCIAWVAVGGTAAKAASAKPVLALRYE